MNKEVKKLWLDALKSGDYIQGKDRLKSLEGKYCCLGVLCDIYSKAGNGSKFFINGINQMPSFFTLSETTDYVLPDIVSEWADLPMQLQTEVATINDQSEDFDPSIDYIETNL